MKIGFDAKRLFLNHTGLGNYSRTLVRNIQLFFPDNQYFLFTPKIELNQDTEFFINNPNFEIIEPKEKSFFWRQWGINQEIKNIGLDVYHGLSHELPFGRKVAGTRYVVTVHDVIFELFPQYYSYIDRKIYSFKYKNSLRKADHIVSISNNTANDINNIWGIPEEKITTIYQTCHPVIIDQNLNEKEKTHFLYVGSITERKNLINVVKALNLFPPDKRKLLIVIGSGGNYLVKIKILIQRLGLSEWVKFIGQVDNAKLVEYYDSSIAFIYPSSYEGFGIPIIEAAYRKIPVITSSTSSMQEAGGPHSFYVEPQDVGNIYRMMSYVLENREIVKERTDESYDYVSKTFDPMNLSMKLMKLYKNQL